jgi:hypothetical protein
MTVTHVAQAARMHRWPAGLAWALWALVMLGGSVIVWLDQLLRQAGRPDLTLLNASGLTTGLAVVSAATVGAVLASRRPAHPVGWLFLVLGAWLVVNGVTYGYTNYGLLAQPGALPAAAHVAAASAGITVPMPVCIGLILLLTPTGSLPSPRWRWWAGVSVAAAVLGLLAWVPLSLEGPYRSIPNPLAAPAALAGPLLVVAWVASVLSALAIPVGAASLLVRFRRARGEERQQLRWVALAAVLASLAALLLLAGHAMGINALLNLAGPAFVVLLPLAIGAAILRYRLYDIDRIISRTLAWALLTLLLAGGYAALALGLGQLLGQDSSLVVAAATLAVAAVFQPARRRIQRLVDRRFNRRRHDAAQTIAAFSTRLRDQVDLDTLTGELLAVVDQTMQPTQASLWLRQGPSNGLAAAVGPGTHHQEQAT